MRGVRTTYKPDSPSNTKFSKKVFQYILKPLKTFKILFYFYSNAKKYK